MAETVAYTIGALARCEDGGCGRVIRVVVDPVTREVTHLVVEPRHRQGLGRLVPVAMAEVGADAGGAGEVRLRCTTEVFERLPAAEETQFVPGTRGYAAYGPEQVLAWPYYGLAGAGVRGDELGTVSQTATYDALPPGEVAVRRGERIHAADGAIGHVQGLIVDPRSHHVTHVLLQEGHLWGRRQVAIPIRAVTSVEDGIQVNMTKQEVQDLPPVDVDSP